MSQYHLPQKLNMPSLEETILHKWQDHKTFEKSISMREGKTPFVFYDGPPSANGMPGIHHVISRTLKDLVCRYKTMQGFKVDRKAGWDTHGLPIELNVEKELGITKEDIGTKISVEDYNKKCRETVLRFKDEWDSITQKMGYWVDLDSPYVTYENDYIESVWHCLKTLYNKDYLYKSVSIQPYSPAAGTGLSSHELNQPGTYKNVKDTSATVLFKSIKNEDSNFLHEKAEGAPVYFLAWTTTPWTLPSNLGLTVGKKIEYNLLQTRNPYTKEEQFVVIASALLPKYFAPEGENAAPDDESKLIPWKIIGTFTGADLEGLRYEQLMPFDSNRAENIDGDPFKIIVGNFVTTEDGTGIVHTAPAFGADDYKVGQKNNLGIVTLVDKEGKFIEGTGEYAGRFVKNYKNEEDFVDVNVDIAVELKLKGRAFKVEKYEHSYPHCWRTDKPIIYYPLDAWFVRTTAVKDRLLELNKTINWKPESTGEGRFGNWLENMVDWNLSRSRFWGTPLPIWRTEDGSEEICCGSIAEIKENLHQNSPEKEIKDVHKPYIDNVILASSKGEKMYRQPDLIDVWFDSGAMPYAQWHYPFENKEKFEENFPADFIAEGVDQTRGWFYTLHALGVLLHDSVAYKTVVSNGLVLDKKGNKMSKRIGNVVDPFETINKFGADATRWYLITNASPWDSLKFDINGIQEVQRKLFNTLFNTYSFFGLYANVDNFSWKEDRIDIKDRPEIDQWILSSLHTLISDVTEAFDTYEPTKAGRAIDTFVDEQLSNWYVRLCRRRFWKGEYDEGKIAAYQTLYECIETLLKLMAPIAPFFTDWMFGEMNKVSGIHQEESIHLVDFPKKDSTYIDKELEEKMSLAQGICSLSLSLRKKENIKVRQPLQKIMIPKLDENTERYTNDMAPLIKSELNIKEISFLERDNNVIKKKAKANFKTLGKKLGSKMKEVAAEIKLMSSEAISSFEQNNGLTLKVNGEEVILEAEDIEITSDEIPGMLVANKGTLTVALDVALTDELIQEGLAREIVNKIQKIRKDEQFELTERINVTVESHLEINQSLQAFNSYICTEILADSLEIVSNIEAGMEIEVNEHRLKLNINKTT
jgi:isoleucyl-tRNA synthetase